MKFWATIFLLLFSSVASFQAHAGMNKWTRLPEPKGGRFGTLRSIPLSWGTIYFAGTADNGVFKSIDGGYTWNQSCGGQPKSYIYAIEYEETPDKTMIVMASLGDGVFKSTDFGETCEEINGGLPSKKAWALAVAPNGNWYVGLWSEGIYVSQDKGENWTPINTGLTTKNISSKLAIDLEGNIYVGSYEGGVFKLPAGFEEWQALTVGLPNLTVIRVFTDNSEGVSKIYANVKKSGLYQLENGVWKADNEGLSQDSVSDYTKDASGTVYLGTLRNGIFTRGVGEITWKPLSISQLLPSNQITKITFGPQGELLVAMNGFGVWRCATGCEQIFYRTDVVSTDIHVDPSGIIFLATYSGLLKSATGFQWASGGRVLGSRYINQITQVGPTLFASNWSELLRSDDGAQTWRKSDKGLEGKYQIRIHSCHLGAQDLLFASTADGIFKSEDGGENWREVSTGLTDKNIWAMGCIPTPTTGEEPSQTSIVVAGNEVGGQLFYSNNFGETWEKVTNDLSKNRSWAFACNPSGSACYAGTLNGFIYKSMDRGGSWQQCTPLEVSVANRDLIMDGEEVFVGNDGGYVFHSTDGCESWQRLGVVLPTDLAWTLAMQKKGDDRTLWVGTAGEGNYQYSFQICGNGKKEFEETCDDGNLVGGDGCAQSCEMEDDDGDGIANPQDNCPKLANPKQEDTDKDGLGDVCDDDDDNDTIPDQKDNCLLVANLDQADLDGDGSGDVCDGDRDGDTILDDQDNCLIVQNKDQEDIDADGQGDLCDEDDDNDGLVDLADNCPAFPNPDQHDEDGDGLGDLCDPTPHGEIVEDEEEIEVFKCDSAALALPAPPDLETGPLILGHPKEPTGKSSATAKFCPEIVKEETGPGQTAAPATPIPGCHLIVP